MFDPNFFTEDFTEAGGVIVTPTPGPTPGPIPGPTPSGPRRGIPINAYKQFKFIDRSGNTYYLKKEEQRYGF